MKTILNTLSFWMVIIPIFSSLSQNLPYTTPLNTGSTIRLTEIIDDPDDPVNSLDSNEFQVLPLSPSGTGASFIHFWWGGDNGFSFAENPRHNHLRAPVYDSFPIVKMTAIPTENYGTGGPPPLTYHFTTEHEGHSLKKVLDPGIFLHVQKYRNAVIHDTMYLIVTYGNSSGSVLNGKLKIDVGNYAEVCDQILNDNKHYFPNNEKWIAGNSEVEFYNLDSTEERSILIPVYINSNREEVLEMKVSMFHGISAEYPDPNGEHQFTLSPAISLSHDPNMMIEESEAKNQCDYSGQKIHYTVKFQNDGEGSTSYIRVECQLDDKVNLDSIINVTVPDRFQECYYNDTIRGKYDGDCGAIWRIDTVTRVLTVEMHDIVLFSSQDPKLPRIDLAQGQIEFDIFVKDNYVFGAPVIAQSKIFFDENPPIVTNKVETGCLKPIPNYRGGGFQDGQSFICKWFWWIVGGLIGLILLLIILFARRRKKRKQSGKS